MQRAGNSFEVGLYAIPAVGNNGKERPGFPSLVGQVIEIRFLFSRVAYRFAGMAGLTRVLACGRIGKPEGVRIEPAYAGIADNQDLLRKRVERYAGARRRGERSGCFPVESFVDYPLRIFHRAGYLAVLLTYFGAVALRKREKVQRGAVACYRNVFQYHQGSLHNRKPVASE